MHNFSVVDSWKGGESLKEYYKHRYISLRSNRLGSEGELVPGGT